MPPPALFAIFMLCSPDLLTCEEHPAHQSEPFTTSAECLEFINVMKEHHNSHHEGESVLLGSCVWRIIKEEE